MTTETTELLAALRALPDDVDMIEHNPDEGPSYHCCGREVQFHMHPSRWPEGSVEGRVHASDCWYVRLVAARAAFEAAQA